MDNYKHNWYVHDSMHFAREMWFADISLVKQGDVIATQSLKSKRAAVFTIP